MGALVAFVIWVVTIALIYALLTGQAQHGALTGVVRVSGLRAVVFAGQSALAETSYALQHPADGGSTVLEQMHDGSQAGTAHDPVATRDLYGEEATSGRLVIDPVKYQVVQKSARSSEPWQIDLSVRVKCTFAGVTLSRQVRRRVLGRICEVTEMVGPNAGKVVLAALAIRGKPLFEVVEP